MMCVRTTIIAKHAEDVRRQGQAGIRLPFQMDDNPVLHALFQIVYLISKTRGYKHIIKLFPHEVADLEPALQLLLSQDRSNHETWETRYVLFLWLSILVLVPFDLATADSQDMTASGLCSRVLTLTIAVMQVVEAGTGARAAVGTVHAVDHFKLVFPPWQARHLPPPLPRRVVPAASSPALCLSASLISLIPGQCVRPQRCVSPDCSLGLTLTPLGCRRSWHGAAHS
jgi:hypothetical protein